MISPANVPDESLIIAHVVVNCLVALREDIAEHYIKNYEKVAIIGINELTTAIPEYSDLYEAFPGTDWNKPLTSGLCVACKANHLVHRLQLEV